MELKPVDSDFNGVRDEVVRLRSLGYGPKQIGQMLGISARASQNIIDSEFVTRFGNRQQMVVQVAMTLDMLARPLLEKYERDTNNGHPDRRDAESVLKIIDSKKRLFALDMPQKLEVLHIEELSVEQLNAELARLGVKFPNELPEAQITKVEQIQEVVEEAEITSVEDKS